MEVGTSKPRGGSGSHIGCSTSGAYAPGPDEEEELCGAESLGSYLIKLPLIPVLSHIYPSVLPSLRGTVMSVFEVTLNLKPSTWTVLSINNQQDATW